MLARHGVEDLFIAYPLWGERKWVHRRVPHVVGSRGVRLAGEAHHADELDSGELRQALGERARLVGALHSAAAES
jgi:hypothetical protein